MSLTSLFGTIHGSCGGERPRSPYLGICWAQGPLRVTLRTIPWNMISIKKEQDKGRHGNF